MGRPLPIPAQWWHMWDDWFDNLICKLFQRFGGGCNDLNGSADDKARAVEGEYREGGPPELPDQQAKQEFLDWLTELEKGIGDEESTLSPVGRELLTTMISDLRTDISE